MKKTIIGTGLFMSGFISLMIILSQFYANFLISNNSRFSSFLDTKSDGTPFAFLITICIILIVAGIVVVVKSLKDQD